MCIVLSYKSIGVAMVNEEFLRWTWPAKVTDEDKRLTHSGQWTHQLLMKNDQQSQNGIFVIVPIGQCCGLELK